MKIFGREPVYVLAFAAILLKMFSAYVLEVSPEAQGAIMAVLSLAVAVVAAVVLRTGAVAVAIVNLAQGVLALFLAFGVELGAEEQVMWMAAVEAAVALFIRREVEPPVAQVKTEQKSPLDGARHAA